MSEDFLEQINRVNMMARDQDGDWDLSPNDRAALKALLDFVGKSALTAPPAAGEELPEGWTWGIYGGVWYAVSPRGQEVCCIDGCVSTDGQAPIAVVLAVIAKNRAGAGT